MRLIGLAKICAILLADYLLGAYVLGPEAALLIPAGVMLYAWLGEYLALLRDSAIRMDNLQDHDRNRLTCALGNLSEDVERASGIKLSFLKLYMVPTDEINAYAYGLRSIAVTRGMLHSCDDATLCAVLAHEVSHIVHLDSVFYRATLASVTVVLGVLAVYSFVGVAMVWIIFAILCCFGVCGGLFSTLLTKGISNLTTGFFSVVQHVVVFLYQATMGLINRGCEYRADRYSCQLGYGPQLSYFLTRFTENQNPGQRALRDILYATHPPTHKRTLRIEQYASQELQESHGLSPY